MCRTPGATSSRPLQSSAFLSPPFRPRLSYYDGYRRERLPANLLQAQRDYFGAHTYERLDKPGSFHSEWLQDRREPKK